MIGRSSRISSKTGETTVARCLDAIDWRVPIDEAFDFLADLSRTLEWDPSVIEATRLTEGAIGLGSRFRVVASLLGQRIPLEYEITEFDRPAHLVLTGGDKSIRSVDEITFVSRSGGTRISYEARLHLSGIRKLADPWLDLLFQRIGRLAMPGLRERLALQRAPATSRGHVGGPRPMECHPHSVTSRDRLRDDLKPTRNP
jgi:hypothetical protein